MTRISVDVNDEWLDAARLELGTESKVETINAALRELADRKRAKDLIATLDEVELDFTESADGWRYGGGRDLSRVETDAREVRSA
jgi:Arc/MetJ family transcription regulator